MLYQATGSNTCARAAVGNLLAVYGKASSHETVRKLFIASSPLPLVTHPMLLRVVARLFPRSTLKWRRCRHFSFAIVAGVLQRIVERGAPALLTFHMAHTKRPWSGVHCVVVVGADGGGIHVLDALGRRNGGWPNATICPDETRLGWEVRGAPLIVTRRPAWILTGLPRRTKE
jgi:hypothetical protein